MSDKSMERIAGEAPPRRIYAYNEEFSSFCLRELEGLHAAWLIGVGNDDAAMRLRKSKLDALEREISRRDSHE